jgi:hypothetical protein
MATTYIPIATQTLSSAASSVTFSSIPATYTDLVLVVNAVQNSNTPVYLRTNGLVTSIYSNTWIRGDGSAASSSRYNTSALGTAGLNLDNFSAQPPFPSGFSGQATYNIMNYSNTTTFKTVLLRHGSSNWTIANVGLIQTTSAITSLEFYPFGTNWASGSTFSLYGIANAGVAGGAKATGGDIVTTDGTYWYHAFLTSGTFTPLQSLTANYLVVAGGGGGGTSSNGGYSAGGGGAGGLRSTVTTTGGGGSLESALSLTAQAYTVTIGAGGAGAATSRSLGTSGSNTTFATITSIGGGGGAAESTTLGQPQSIGRSGGSGGGGGTVLVGTGGGSGTANQGYAGGGGSEGYNGGGGGGAGGVGANAQNSSAPGGIGGVGVQITAFAAPTGTGVNGGFYAGGGTGSGYTTSTASNGGGGTGGAGSGGTGASSGIVNTGGGGGANTVAASGAGGSGIVIVRYPI